MLVDFAWLIYNSRSKQSIAISRHDGWTVDIIMTQNDDLFSPLPNKLEPIEDEE